MLFNVFYSLFATLQPVINVTNKQLRNKGKEAR